MEHVSIKASQRPEHGKGPSRRLRSTGKVPTVAYGKFADHTLNLAIDHDALLKVLGSPKGKNTLVYLEVEGDKMYPVMVREFAIHPISRRLLHADFLTIDENAPIEVDIPFVTTGKAKGEAEGGTVLINARRLPIRCLPVNIPVQISHDVSHLGMEEGIKVKELAVPAGVEVLLPAERRIVVVKAPKAIEEEVKPADAAAAEGAEGAAAAAPGAEGGAAPAAAAPAAAEKPAKKGKE
jgi:large subunit ribosomal protein L25